METGAMNFIVAFIRPFQLDAVVDGFSLPVACSALLEESVVLVDHNRVALPLDVAR